MASRREPTRGRWARTEVWGWNGNIRPLLLGEGTPRFDHPAVLRKPAYSAMRLGSGKYELEGTDAAVQILIIRETKDRIDDAAASRFTGIPLQACAAWVERWPLILGLIQDPFAASIRQQVRTMNAEADTKTVELITFRETREEVGGLDPHQYVYWADNDAEDEHPYWVIDFIEAGGWMKHIPEVDEGEKMSGITVEYNPEERNDIRKITLPDGTEVTER